MSASSEGAQKLLRLHEEMDAQREHNDLLAVMALPEGRRLLWDLVVRAGVFEQSFAVDALQTAFREGQRSVGIDLFERLKSEATDSYIQALNEQLVEQRRAKELREAAKAEAATNEEERETTQE